MTTGVELAAGLPHEAWAAAVAGTGVGPARLAKLLGDRMPDAAWRIASGAPGEAAGIHSTWAALGAQQIAVHVHGHYTSPGYPARLAADHEPPAVLFSRGSLEAVDEVRPLVSIVGTRRCTHTGREVAAQLGRELAEAGVSVVSGLALGIDGAAHKGALSTQGAPPVGVVGSGLDVVYPRAHESLWHAVAERGLLLSEAPLGGRPEAWRFPARNRILAALADVVVVVESHLGGGSMHTVRAAEERGRMIMAVPGSVRNPASAGTNKLLSEGLPPARDTDDVLTALALVTAGGPGLDQPSPHTAAPVGVIDSRPPPSGVDAEVLGAVGWEPTSVESVLRRTDIAAAQTAASLSRLQRQGWVRGQAGWWERVEAAL